MTMSDNLDRVVDALRPMFPRRIFSDRSLRALAERLDKRGLLASPAAVPDWSEEDDHLIWASDGWQVELTDQNEVDLTLARVEHAPAAARSRPAARARLTDLSAEGIGQALISALRYKEHRLKGMSDE